MTATDGPRKRQPDAGAPGEDGAFKPRGGAFGFFFMVLGMFMAILDIQIVASSLPEIQAGVSASVDQITWVQTAYLVAEVVMIPLSGWLARVMSSRWLFSASAAGFTITSVMCAFSWDTSSLIFFRAIQGFVGGAMIPTVFAANFKLFPPERRMVGTVVIGLTATVAPAIGPTLGGYITEFYAWEWLFLVNVVPGLIVTIVVPLAIDIDEAEPGLLGKIDILGIVLVAGFLGSLEFVLDEGPREDWFEDRTIFIFAIVSAASAIGLFWRELTVEHPVLELHAFTNRNFTVGCILTFVLGICLYGQTFILPQVLSQVRGYNSLQIGEVMFVTGAAMFSTAPIAGRLTNSVDPRKLLVVGFLVVATGLYLNSLMNTEVAFWDLFLPQAVRGIGLILCIVPITAAALGTLPTNLVSGGSGLFNLFRNMGGAVGLAMINTMWDGRYDRHYWWITEKLSDTNAVAVEHLNDIERALSANPAVGDPSLAAYQTLTQEVSLQANIMAWDDVFFMIAVAFIVAMPLIFLLAKPKPGEVSAH
ncbi:DHA2 family efflux MFS transporter permease subunit [Rhodobium gokarnense]|uniref:DHA2 family multidrug resistance protein n=1 Tax=Rhodobium gokarnense TaxID=364296 RepID=A0ABT3HBL5_9HYPH|nr:DHA2 family efflux MFS transporter permease subunit [Rhodobium gokarnense]MCW2307744.1 DHA2 family multidrug resistance protein [Rhodobium gokarnense]